MPRNYQLKRYSKYLLPHDVYMQMIYVIKDYNRLIQERERIMYGTPFNDGQPRGTDISDPTESKAIRLAAINSEIEAIDQTSMEMIGRYSDRAISFKPLEAFHNYGYFSGILGRNDGYCERTWKRYRQKFAYLVAKKLHKN